MSVENEEVRDVVENLDQKTRSRLKSLVEDVEKQKLVMQSARDSVNGSRKLAKDDCGISVSIFNKLVDMRLDQQKVQKAKQDLEASENLYDDIFGE